MDVTKQPLIFIERAINTPTHEGQVFKDGERYSLEIRNTHVQACQYIIIIIMSLVHKIRCTKLDIGQVETFKI